MISIQFIGSAAAWAQSVFYGSATSGLFSALQSAGATAVMPSALSLLTGSAATAAGAATLASGLDKDDDDAPAEELPSPSSDAPPPDSKQGSAKPEPRKTARKPSVSGRIPKKPT